MSQFKNGNDPITCENLTKLEIKKHLTLDDAEKIEFSYLDKYENDIFAISDKYKANYELKIQKKLLTVLYQHRKQKKQSDRNT